MSDVAAAPIWNSLEVVKLVIGILTPLSVAAFGLFISRHLKRFELLQWSNQNLIEKRLTLYDSLAPKLNILLCFYTWVGNWKTISPEDVIKTKRELDQCINIYRHLFDNEVYEAYQRFIHLLFLVFQGAGEDAKIRSFIHGPDGDRTIHCSFTWQSTWNERFAPAAEVPSHKEIRQRYYEVMNALRNSLGVKH